MSTATVGTSAAAPRPRTNLRPNYPRSRHGCLTCRRRKKKCDEIAPLCTNCARKDLECTWPILDTQRCSKQAHSGSGVPPQPAAEPAAPAGHSSRTRSSLPPVHSEDKDQPWKIGTVPCGIRWDATLGAFTGPERACSKTPLSVRFLEHYLAETGAMLAMAPPSKSPFITSLIPAAYTDDLLMHTMLALSGAHLGFKQSTNEITRATWSHYLLVIRSIREEVGNTGLQHDPAKTVRLLLVLVMLCHYEALSGNTTGNLFQHLRASRQLILWLLPGDSSSYNDLLGFAMELYAYLLLSNTFAPYGASETRTLPYDPFITSLSSVISPYATFGTMFAGGHALFELIPQISVLQSQRLTEEAQGSGGPSMQLRNSHDTLAHAIDRWTFPDQPSDPDPRDRKKAAEALRHGLRIYLATAFCGSVVSDPKVICAMQDEVDMIISIIQDLSDLQYLATLLWPILIAASCMVKDDQRAEVAAALSQSHYQMSHLSMAVNLLEKLWKDKDQRAYGPYGLYFIMEKYGVHFSII